MLATLVLIEYASNVMNLAVYVMVVHLINVFPVILDSTLSTTPASHVILFVLAALVLLLVNVSTVLLVISS